MENNPNLYRIIIEFIWQSGIRFHDLRCLFTFARAITGLLLSSKVNLGEWAVFGKSSVQASSKERQFSRWIHNRKINPSLVYRPMIWAVLAEWDGKRMYLGYQHVVGPIRAGAGCFGISWASLAGELDGFG